MASKLSVHAHAMAFAGLAAFAFAGFAHADEAFLCGPDVVVYVKPAELEQKKKTDKCVASYFGLKVEADAANSAPAKAPSKGEASANAKDALALKTLPAPETSDPVTRKLSRTADLAPPSPTPGTDYRNVRVINAAEPSGQWFKHTR